MVIEGTRPAEGVGTAATERASEPEEGNMHRDDQATHDDGLQQYLRATVSRAQMLTAAGAGLAAAILPGAAAAESRTGRIEFPFFPQVRGSYTPEAILDILNILDTFERVQVTYLTYALTKVQLSGLNLAVAQASLATAQYHVDFLESLGAHSLTDSIFPRVVPAAANIIPSREVDTTHLIAGYMTAAREFAELGQPLLVKNAYQAGATWAEIRAATRTLSAVAGASPALIPPNNKAFGTDHYLYVRDMHQFLVDIGLYGNKGMLGPSPVGELRYPGREAALAAAGPMAAAVIQKTPNNASVSTSVAGLLSSVGAAGLRGKLVGERGSTP
jgi:hypothetical protein